jgi:hypothetical protein
MGAGADRLLGEKQFKVFRLLRCLERGPIHGGRAMPPSDASTGMFTTLHGLETALAYTRAAMLAAHPDLNEDGPHGRRLMKLDAAGWTADEILTHLDGLAQAITRYTVELERARTRSMVAAVRPPREKAA